MADFYRDLLLDHYKHPRNFGSLIGPDARVEEGNVTCGDRIVMDIQVQKTKFQILSEVKFNGEGCAISRASASLLTEKVKGMELSAVMNLRADDVLEMIGTPLTPSRIRCAMLALEVLQKAVGQVYSSSHGRK